MKSTKPSPQNYSSRPGGVRENTLCLPVAKQSAGAADAKPDQALSRMADIREMLVHAAMTILERSERIAEYVQLADADDKVGHDDLPPAGGQQPHDQGIHRAARELKEAFPGKSEEAVRMHIRRALAVVSISSDAKNLAVANGLANRMNSLLQIAKEKAPEGQLEKVSEIAREINNRAPASRGDARRAGLKRADAEIEILKSKVAEREKTIGELTARIRTLEAELDTATAATVVSQQGAEPTPLTDGNTPTCDAFPDLPASLDRRQHNAESAGGSDGDVVTPSPVSADEVGESAAVAPSAAASVSV
jgi:hypothetical protein